MESQIPQVSVKVLLWEFLICSLSAFRNRLKKETGGRNKRREALLCLLLPKTPRSTQQRCDENMGKRGSGSWFTTVSLFAIGNRNNQATETKWQRTIPWMHYRKGGKIPAGRTASQVFSFVNYFSRSCLLQFTVQFNKLNSKPNKTPTSSSQLQKPPVLGKVLRLPSGTLYWGYSTLKYTHTMHPDRT